MVTEGYLLLTPQPWTVVASVFCLAVERNKALIRADKLQQLHTLHNLAQLLGAQGSRPSQQGCKEDASQGVITGSAKGTPAIDGTKQRERQDSTAVDAVAMLRTVTMRGEALLVQQAQQIRYVGNACCAAGNVTGCRAVTGPANPLCGRPGSKLTIFYASLGMLYVCAAFCSFLRKTIRNSTAAFFVLLVRISQRGCVTHAPCSRNATFPHTQVCVWERVFPNTSLVRFDTWEIHMAVSAGDARG